MPSRRAPVEVAVNIFRFLPGDDLIRFKRLCKRHAEIMEKHKKSIQAKRPVVDFEICSEGPPESFVKWGAEGTMIEPIYLKITHRGRSKYVVFHYSLEICDGALRKSFHFAMKGKDMPCLPVDKLTIFLEWLFSRVDIHNFSIFCPQFFTEKFRAYQNEKFALTTALGKSGCHIHHFWIDNQPLNLLENGNMDFLLTFARESPELHVQYEHYDLFLNSQEQESFDLLCRQFEKITFHCHEKNMDSLLFFLAKLLASNQQIVEWKNAFFAKIEHWLYENLSNLLQHRRIPKLVDLISRRGIEVCDELKKNSWYDLVKKEGKQEITMRRTSDGAVLRMKMEKKGRETNIQITVDNGQ